MVIVAIVFVLVVIFNGRRLDNINQDIIENRVLTSAIVKDAHYVFKSGVHLEFEIKVNGISYSNFSFAHCLYCPYQNFIGKRFPVIYSSRNPNHLEMLVYPKDFEKFGMTFPDSLNWVNSYR